MNRGKLRDEALRKDIMARHDALFALVQHSTKSYDENTAEIRGIRAELQAINVNFRATHEQSLIAAEIARIALNEDRIARWECDAKGNCVNMNRAGLVLFNLTHEEAMGIGWTRRIYDDKQRREVMQEFRAAYADPDNTIYSRTYAIKPHNALVNVVAKAVSVLKNADGHVLRMFGTVEIIDDVAA
jgi:PAS domain-containing protein